MFRLGISAVGPGVGLLIAVALRERDPVRTFDLRNGVVVPLCVYRRRIGVDGC